MKHHLATISRSRVAAANVSNFQVKLEATIVRLDIWVSLLEFSKTYNPFDDDPLGTRR